MCFGILPPHRSVRMTQMVKNDRLLFLLGREQAEGCVYEGLKMSAYCLSSKILLRKAWGDVPAYCLKYLPKKLCVGKLYSIAISLTLLPE